tara:strand:+ start:342 stop:548 length:207 start_codon:yes stop_codon:yes gene_type:complete
MFQLIINGENQTFSSPIKTIKELLERLNISEKGRIIELNNKIIKKENFSTVTLKNKDSIEIIQFMGGG